MRGRHGRRRRQLSSRSDVEMSPGPGSDTRAAPSPGGGKLQLTDAGLSLASPCCVSSVRTSVSSRDQPRRAQLDQTRPDQWWQITQRKVEEHYFQLLKSISCAVIYNCWSQVHWPVIESESVILVSMLDIAQWPGASEDEDEGGAGADGDDDGQPQTLGGGSGAHEERLDTITKKILTYI